MPKRRLISLRPYGCDRGNVQAHYNLGLVFSPSGTTKRRTLISPRPYGSIPAIAKAYNASAMIKAACPEAKFRDGKGAVAIATRACELTKWKNPIILDTLAAAQAEADDFAAAVKSETRALELLTDERQKDDYRSRLVLYQAKKPYRQVSPQLAPTQASP